MLQRACLAIAVAALVACGTAKQVQKNNGGGILELSGEWTSAFDSAHAKMDDHCGANNYAIVDEGFHVAPDVGAKQGSAQASAQGSAQGSAQNDDGWRVYYICYASNTAQPKLPPFGGQ